MKIEKIDIKNLNPAKYNPRKDLKPGDEEYEKLKRSIEEFGFVEPIVWNKTTGNIIGGHQRFKILLDSGVPEIDCVVLELDKTKEKALNIALNKINGDWDKEKLTFLISDLQASDFDVSLTGFDATEIAGLFDLTGKNEAKDDDFDFTKSLEEPPFAKFGDLWLLGKHRLLCGDSTNFIDVARVMNGKHANMCLTDAPYNVNYQGSQGKILNDNMPKRQFYEFLVSVFKNVYENLAGGGAFYCFHSDSEKVNFFNAVVDSGFHYSTTCIWVKNSLVLGRLDYQQRHEPCIYAFKDTKRHAWYSDRKQTSVWEFDRPAKSEYHSTQKPVPLMAYPIKNSTQPNGIRLPA
jgi:hypothetical protein